MPRIIDRVLDCSIYLYENEADAHTGKRTGGSGFMFIIPFDEKDPYGQQGVGSTYAVSNWHVVSFAPTIRLTTADGDIDVVAASTEEWMRHPDGETDLAVLPLRLERGKHRIAALAPAHLVFCPINNFTKAPELGED